jgi:hypothetical protein
MGAVARIMDGRAAGQAGRRTAMIDATCLEAHRTASGLCLRKGGVAACSAAVRGAGNDPVHRSPGHGGTNTSLHAVADREGRAVRVFVTAGQVGDGKGARVPERISASGPADRRPRP